MVGLPVIGTPRREAHGCGLCGCGTGRAGMASRSGGRVVRGSGCARVCRGAWALVWAARSTNEGELLGRRASARYRGLGEEGGGEVVCGAGSGGVSRWEWAGRRMSVARPQIVRIFRDGHGGACEQSEDADSTETEFTPYGDIRSYCTANGRYGTKGSSELQRVLWTAKPEVGDAWRGVCTFTGFTENVVCEVEREYPDLLREPRREQHIGERIAEVAPAPGRDEPQPHQRRILVVLRAPQPFSPPRPNPDLPFFPHIGDYGASTMYRLPSEATIRMSTGLCGSEPYIVPEHFLDKPHQSDALYAAYAAAAAQTPPSLAPASSSTAAAASTSTSTSTASSSARTSSSATASNNSNSNNMVFPSTISNMSPRAFRPLLRKMLEPDPKARSSVETVLGYAWMHGVEMCWEVGDAAHRVHVDARAMAGDGGLSALRVWVGGRAASLARIMIVIRRRTVFDSWIGRDGVGLNYIAGRGSAMAFWIMRPLGAGSVFYNMQ
ncbi:hypothetical protein C8J57DRAFT_1233399 [Mycena rebaudengoi]|nr:hypothetical protein C8J57DRAFT_1233399 [Mycena rebaudengoi]